MVPYTYIYVIRIYIVSSQTGTIIKYLIYRVFKKSAIKNSQE